MEPEKHTLSEKELRQAIAQFLVDEEKGKKSKERKSNNSLSTLSFPNWLYKSFERKQPFNR